MSPASRLWPLILAAAAWPTLAQEAPPRPPKLSDPIVKVKGHTLTYIGEINDRGLQKLSSLVSTLKPGQVTKMLVNSPGGDTNSGISIGAIMVDLAPHLTIEVGCFSSCADFIAPAAKSITLRKNSFLGWHGNDRQYQVIAAQTGVSVSDQLRAIFAKQFPDGKGTDGKSMDMDALVKEAVADIDKLVAREASFYGRLGVSDKFAICGVGTRFDSRFTGKQVGWGFSIADMKRLGLPPVTYEGPGAYENNPSFRYYLIKLTPEDC